MTPKNAIFLCYRREDSNDLTIRIYYYLVEAFGADAVFLDQIDFKQGDDWENMTRPTLQKAKAVVVVIGKKWVEIGKTRLKAADDPVKNELDLCFRNKGCAILPVAIDKTPFGSEVLQILRASQIDKPTLEILAKLFRLTALNLESTADFYGIEKLIHNLDDVPGIDRIDLQEETPLLPIWAVASVATLLVTMIAALIWVLIVKAPTVAPAPPPGSILNPAILSETGKNLGEPTPPKTPSAWTESEALSWTLENRGTARVKNSQGDLIEVHTSDEIPQTEFRIDSLSLTGSHADINTSLARLRGFGALRELELSGTELNDAGASQLKSLASLSSLNIVGCPVSVDGFKSVGQIKQLRFLRIGDLTVAITDTEPTSDLHRITDACLLELRSLSRLETLTISSRNVTDTGVNELIEYLPDLVSLQIEFVPLNDAALSQLANLRHLRTLGLVQCDLTDGSIEALSRLRSLTQLNVQGNQITPDGVRRLQESLPGCRVYGGEYSVRRNLVRVIVQGKGSVKVSVGGGTLLNVTDESFNALPDEFTVQQVDLSNVRPLPPDLLQLKDASELILTDSAISNYDLRTIPSQFPVLTVLNLAGTSVTDEEINAIATMPSLQSLDVSRTKVTDVGLNRLRSANPSCEIHTSSR